MGNIFKRLFGKKTKSLSDIKIIFSDIDGTLYNRQGELRPQTRRYALELHKAGVNLILATGREHQVAEEALDGLGLTAPIISLDGALVREPGSGKILHIHPIEEKYIAPLFKEIENHKISFTIMTPEGNYYNEEPDLPSHLQHPETKHFKTEALPKAKDNFLRIFLTGNRAFITSLYEKIQKNQLLHVNDFTTYESRRESGKHYLEIKPHTSNKGIAVSHILQARGLQPADAAGIGDYRNDVEMLRACGYRVAMADAVAELRDIADYITSKNCEEGGIEEFFQMVLKAKRNAL
ncbi:MAG TPA: HAD family hydrolase [Patescibacteria group bacterium]|nr:HAD family hydrolase [Patescibacteria group bacterium]